MNSPLQVQRSPYILPYPVKAKSAENAMGRVILLMVHLSNVLLNIALKIFNIFFFCFASNQLESKVSKEHTPDNLLVLQATPPVEAMDSQIELAWTPGKMNRDRQPADIGKEPFILQHFLSPDDLNKIKSKKICTPPILSPLPPKQSSPLPKKSDTPHSPAEVKKVSDIKKMEIKENPTEIVSHQDREALAYLANKEIVSETNPAKIEQIFQWVLAHANNSSIPMRKLMEEFIADVVKKHQSKGVESDSAYIQWIEELQPSQFKTYVQLLHFEGAHPPLFYHLKKEHQAAELTGKSSQFKIGERLKILFSTFTKPQAEALLHCDDFWSLIFPYPDIAAEFLKADVLGVFAQNEKKHNLDFKMLVSRIPENNELFEKLSAIAPHATEALEAPLSFKAGKLVLFDYVIPGTTLLATKEQKKEFKSEILKKIKTGLENRRLEKQKKIAQAKLEGSKTTPQKPSPKKWVVGSPQKAVPTPPVVAIKPKPQLPDHQCLSFLKEKPYQRTCHKDTEEIVFDWILTHEALFDDENTLSDILAFLEYTLSNPLYIETMLERLEAMSSTEYRFFIKLLGKDWIEKLWNLEAKFLFAASKEAKKIARLKVAFDSLTEEQLAASIQSEKFYEVLNKNPDELAKVLTKHQLDALAKHAEKQKEALYSLGTLTSKMRPDEVADFNKKLLLIAPAAVPRNELSELKELRTKFKAVIESKMTLCNSETRKKLVLILQDQSSHLLNLEANLN